MKTFIQILFVTIFFAGAGGLLYLWTHQERQPPQPAAPAVQTTPSPTPTPTEAAIEYPLTDTGESKEPGSGNRRHEPLPSLNESDQTIQDALSDLFGKEVFIALFYPQEIVRRIVATIDSASAHPQFSPESSPVRPPSTDFRTAGRGDAVTIAPANYHRYDPYVRLARAVDSRRLVQLYRHFYPLFQAAYLDQGVKGYFNDRLIHVIDLLLKTPVLLAPPRVARPGIEYKYKLVDPRLEDLSGAQKLLLRMGPENAEVIKAKLREIRALLIPLGK